MNSLPTITRRGTADRFALPDDGFIPLVLKGEFPHPESGLVQVIDDDSVRSIFNLFSPSTRIDFDHFSYDVDKPSNAAGWMERSDLQIRPDGLYARPRWTDEGESALADGKYRFVSPVFLKGDLEFLQGNYVRPHRLDSAGLTNNPNMKGLAPITNRRPWETSRKSRWDFEFRNDARDFLVLVNRARLEASSFSEAWRITACKYPEIFRGFLEFDPHVFRNRSNPLWHDMLGALQNGFRSIRNRLPDFRVIHPSDWDLAVAQEPKAMGCLAACEARREAGVPQVVTPESINSIIRGKLTHAQGENPNWSTSDAIAWLKEAWPELWALWVILRT